MSILRETSISCLLALSLLGTAACGGDDVTPQVDSNDPNEPEPVDPDPCLLRFDTEPLRWSTVGVGYTASQLIEFSNEGDESCSVTLEVTGDGFDTEAATIVVSADAKRTVAVAWSPTVAGPTTGKFRVTSGELSEEIGLEGEAVASCLTLAPRFVDFGEAAPGCSTVEKVARIKNGCSHPASIASFDFESTEVNAPEAVFGIRQFPPLGERLDPGTTVPLTVAYRPLEVGDDSDVLTVFEASGAGSSIELNGSGRLGARRLDTFEQPMRPRVNVLLVVDDSPAMAPYAAKLGPLAEDLAAFLRKERFVAKLGVTTTSRTPTDGCVGSGADGRLVPVDGSSPRWFETDSDIPLSAFSDLLAIGTCSEAPNEGLASAVRAVTDPLASQMDDPTHPEEADGNAGFLRDDEGLITIFVSASDDASGDTVDAWRAQLLQGRFTGRFTVRALVAPESGCDAATAGTRYAEFVQLTGIVANICDEASWNAESLLGFYPNVGFGYRSRFFLSGRPADADGDGSLANEIIVEVDGEEVAAIGDDGEVRWIYKAAANAVDFVPDHAPAEGSQITISYFASCV